MRIERNILILVLIDAQLCKDIYSALIVERLTIGISPAIIIFPIVDVSQINRSMPAPALVINNPLTALVTVNLALHRQTTSIIFFGVKSIFMRGRVHHY